MSDKAAYWLETEELPSEQDAASVLDAGELSQLWERIRGGLRRDIGARMFDQWLRPAELGDYCDHSRSIEICLPTDFAVSFVASNFGDRLRLAWRSVNRQVEDVRFVRAAAGTRPNAPMVSLVVPSDDVKPIAAAQQSSAPRGEGFQPRHDFARFIVGQSNALAFSAAQAMAAIDTPRFNPLFLHAGTGQGKTHLLHAIAEGYALSHPAASIIYMSAERFMVEFVNAMRANETLAFKARLRGARLLLIDDIQFIAGKGSTQEEFLHTVNELIDSGARIVISADRPPQMLDGIDPRILSRLAGGLVADIQPAELELRLSILRALRGQDGEARVPDDVLDLLARAIRTNVRELEGAFNKLIAYAQLTGRVVDMEFAQYMLADAIRANARRITIEDIQKATAQHYKLEQSEMRSKRRARAVARPRQVAMYLAKKMTPRSLPEIGRMFGGRDHSTVIHAVRTIESLRLGDNELDADIRALERRLEL